MRKIACLFSLIVSLVLTLSTTLSASADSGPFQPIMEDYKAYLYSGILPSEDSLVNPQIAKLDGTDDQILMLTYDLADINLDGNPELVVAIVNEDKTYRILDIFTDNAGTAERVFKADDKSKAYLTTNNGILCELTDEYAVLFGMNGTELEAVQFITDGTAHDLVIDTFYTHQIQADTVINMDFWHEYNGTDVKAFGEPFTITSTPCADGTFDYVIPVTFTASKIGMEMSMTKYAYLNTKDFPAKILMTIDDESFVLVFNLSPEGEVYFDRIPVDSAEDLYPGC